MILFPPKHFDANELYIIGIIVITWILMFALPKRLSSLTVMSLWTLNIFFAVVADITLGVPPYDLYDTVDRSEFEIFDVIQYVIGYPPFAYLALHYYVTRQPKGFHFILFILSCAAITTFLEWIGVLLGVYHYKGWKLYLSLILYVVVYIANVLLLKLIKKESFLNTGVKTRAKPG